jgi:hypothetical protein
MLDRTNLVLSIVDELRRPPSKLTCPEKEVRAELSNAITNLSDNFSRNLDWEKNEDKKYAQKFLRAVDRQKNLLLAAPPDLFTPFELQKAIRTMDRLAAEARGYLMDGGKIDGRKLLAAFVAFAVIMKFSNQSPSAGTDDTPFCTIASWIFEAATGQHEPNLQRGCKQALRLYRQMKTKAPFGPFEWFLEWDGSTEPPCCISRLR